MFNNGKTFVTNCGKYDCRHNKDGYCTTPSIGIDKDGKCILASKKPVGMQPGTYSSTFYKEPENRNKTQVIG